MSDHRHMLRLLSCLNWWDDVRPTADQVKEAMVQYHPV